MSQYLYNLKYTMSQYLFIKGEKFNKENYNKIFENLKDIYGYIIMDNNVHNFALNRDYDSDFSYSDIFKYENFFDEISKEDFARIEYFIFPLNTEDFETLEGMQKVECKTESDFLEARKNIKKVKAKKEKPVKNDIEELVSRVITPLIKAEVDKIDLESLVESIKNKSIEKHIETTLIVNGKAIEGLNHSQLEIVIKLVSLKEPLFLFGPAGSGKTSLACKAAEALGLEYSSISVNEQTTKTDFLGYFDAHSVLVRTPFRERYENGGVFIIDEIDAANPNVLTVLNSALSNGFMSYPDGNIKKHENFICISTANTCGDQTDIKYIGRNILDAATLDRFIRMFIDYDVELENKLLHKDICNIRDTIRKYIKQKSLDTFISTRTLLQIQKLYFCGVTAKTSVLLAMQPDQNILDLIENTKYVS